MGMGLQDLNIHKIVQAVSYLQERCDCTNYMKLVKMLFFADRHIFRHHGILLTNDHYVALKDGPVCSSTLNIFTKNEDWFYNSLSSEEKEYLNDRIKYISEYDRSVKEVDDSWLSIADKNALDFAIENFGKFDQFQLRDIAHDYPEWKRYEDYFKRKLTKKEDIIMTDFFDDPDIGKSEYIKKYLNSKDPYEDDLEFLQDMKEEFAQFNSTSLL